MMPGAVLSTCVWQPGPVAGVLPGQSLQAAQAPTTRRSLQRSCGSHVLLPALPLRTREAVLGLSAPWRLHLHVLVLSLYRFELITEGEPAELLVISNSPSFETFRVSLL